MMATLKDVVLGTPAGNKAVEEALKKSCEDQVKLLEESGNKEAVQPLIGWRKDSKKEDEIKEIRQVNIDLLRIQLSKAPDTRFEYKWFINELRSCLDAIETSNEVLDDIFNEL